MDPTTGAAEGTETVTDASPAPEGGQAEIVQDASPEVQYFDPSAYADSVVRIKVDGEDLEVPLSEAIQGYSRTADYTRKTQALAQERQEISFWKTVDAAAQNDPSMVLDLLARRYGVQTAPTVPQVQPQSDDDWQFEESDEPLDPRLAALQAQLQPVAQYVAQQQATQLLNTVVAGLKQQYPDFDEKAVITEAVRRGHDDPRVLESVYKEMAFDRMRIEQSASQQLAATRAAEEAARAQAAAQAAALIATGGSSNEVATAAPQAPSGRMSIRDAFELALAQQKR